MNIIATPAVLAKANRQRWAAPTLHDRAMRLVREGHITRGFRAHRASMRCHTNANHTFRTATRSA